MNVSIDTDENDLINVLNQYIKNKDVAALVFDTFSSNNTSIQWLFKMHMGNSYPIVPKIGTVGYINLSKYGGWQGDVEKYKNSSYCQQGYIKVGVKDWKGLNHYYPLVVEATAHSENGQDWNSTFHIDCNEFITVNEFDAYDISDIAI
jgi:hypothetical protein